MRNTGARFPEAMAKFQFINSVIKSLYGGEDGGPLGMIMTGKESKEWQDRLLDRHTPKRILATGRISKKSAAKLAALLNVSLEDILGTLDDLVKAVERSNGDKLAPHALRKFLPGATQATELCLAHTLRRTTTHEMDDIHEDLRGLYVGHAIWPYSTPDEIRVFRPFIQVSGVNERNNKLLDVRMMTVHKSELPEQVKDYWDFQGYASLHGHNMFILLESRISKAELIFVTFPTPTYQTSEIRGVAVGGRFNSAARFLMVRTKEKKPEKLAVTEQLKPVTIDFFREHNPELFEKIRNDTDRGLLEV